jgi:hypothetical protein
VGKGHKLNRKSFFEKKDKRLLTGSNPQANRDSNNESNFFTHSAKGANLFSRSEIAEGYVRIGEVRVWGWGKDTNSTEKPFREKNT